MSWIEWTDNKFRDLDLRRLKVDEAYLNVSNKQSVTYYLYSLSADCVKCPFRLIKEVKSGCDTLVTINTARKFQLSLYSENRGLFVNRRDGKDLYWTKVPDVGEFGVYDLIITENGTANFENVKEPVSTTLPILVITFILFALYFSVKFIKDNFLSDYLADLKAKTAKAKNIVTTDSSSKKRLKCLDIFRGFSIVLMIFGNCGGGHYWWIEHATWNGLHLADLVFPWFLFIMGICIPLSIKSLIKQDDSVRSMILRVFKRSIVLFILGVCFNTLNGSSLEELRIFGVLQKFGIAYFIVSLIYISFISKNSDTEKLNNSKSSRYILDIVAIWKQWIVILAIIAVHILIIFGLKAPNCDRGYFGPGGIHENQTHENCTGGIAGYIDRLLLSEHHLYKKATAMAVYATRSSFDPEGPFGSLLACVQAFLGVQCCMIFLHYQKPSERLIRWIFWGFFLLVVTACLTSFTIDDGLVPINKNLWSLSFVTVTAALAFLIISLIYFLVDVKNFGDDCWTLFLYPGMNPIVIYVGHFVFHHMWPFRWKFDGVNTHFGFMLENFYNVILWIFISHWMYYRNIFYKV